MLEIQVIKFGPLGPSGPPNTLTIGEVTTGAPGSEAVATITGDPPNQVLNLTIPAGVDAELPAGLLQILADTDVENPAGLRFVPNETGGLDLALWNQDAATYQRLRIVNVNGTPTLAFEDLIT